MFLSSHFKNKIDVYYLHQERAPTISFLIESLEMSPGKGKLRGCL